LPPVLADDATTVREVLVSQRQVAVAAATRLRNQAHQLLLQADPDYRAHLPAVTTPEGITALEGYQAPQPRALQEARAAALRWRSPRRGGAPPPQSWREPSAPCEP